jgi:hypothetical protein
MVQRFSVGIHISDRQNVDETAGITDKPQDNYNYRQTAGITDKHSHTYIT